MKYINPKALNLDAVRNSSESSVTLGFKCPPELKLILAEEAEKAGLTLSNYVYQLVDFEMKEKFLMRQQNELLTAALEKVDGELKFFKNKHLFDLLQKQKGKASTYINRDGKVVNVVINSIEDVYELMINSFKYEQ